MIYDISQPMTDSMAVYPGDPKVHVETISNVATGAPFSLTKLTMGSHTGTHVDAQSHIFSGGKTTDGIPLEILMGPCYLASACSDMEISKQDLQDMEMPPATTRLLVYTKARSGYLSPEAASHLVENGVKLVGLDSASVDAPASAGLPIHRTLLEAETVIVENLALDDVKDGAYWLACLPLRIAGCDGAPARAVLMDVPPKLGQEVHSG